MIKLVNLCLKFTKEYYALLNINITVDKGERVCIFGQSESGKTSILRTIAGLEKEYTGEAFINNKEVKTIDFKYDVNLAYLPKQSVFFNNKTVAYNLEYAIKLRDNKYFSKSDNILTFVSFLSNKPNAVKISSIFCSTS